MSEPLPPDEESNDQADAKRRMEERLAERAKPRRRPIYRMPS